LIGSLQIPAAQTEAAEYQTKVTGAGGVHDLYLVFKGKPDSKLFKLHSWRFNQ
jgi:arabinoxylan arabinofuranohydrolase